ncbi:hypothetical protein FIBSPDRAFT_1040760 [Athelia psychrophila]|uniref:Uncharacterized protein n=1 Tax=Athelia psychrophila TaxID=1759441 RepID=A0A166PVS7_9AGAM|nr:hypothetical protein FIBSPDRAFT_1040760 [Fibularhizoctonia sp. CBS 109695]
MAGRFVFLGKLRASELAVGMSTITRLSRIDGSANKSCSVVVFSLLYACELDDAQAACAYYAYLDEAAARDQVRVLGHVVHQRAAQHQQRRDHQPLHQRVARGAVEEAFVQLEQVLVLLRAELLGRAQRLAQLVALAEDVRQVREQEHVVDQHEPVAVVLVLAPVQELRHLGEEREARDGRLQLLEHALERLRLAAEALGAAELRARVLQDQAAVHRAGAEVQAQRGVGRVPQLLQGPVVEAELDRPVAVVVQGSAQQEPRVALRLPPLAQLLPRVPDLPQPLLLEEHAEREPPQHGRHHLLEVDELVPAERPERARLLVVELEQEPLLRQKKLDPQLPQQRTPTRPAPLHAPPPLLPPPVLVGPAPPPIVPPSTSRSPLLRSYSFLAPLYQSAPPPLLAYLSCMPGTGVAATTN